MLAVQQLRDHCEDSCTDRDFAAGFSARPRNDATIAGIIHPIASTSPLAQLLSLLSFGKHRRVPEKELSKEKQLKFGKKFIKRWSQMFA